MEYFCTLFDHRYLFRGLALYESLERTMKTGFHLYILCMDKLCYQELNRISLKYVTLIAVHEIETEQLLLAKGNRTEEEYCWTCTPAIIKYILETYLVKRCTYLDADIYFFDSPKALFTEMDEQDVLIIEHRYTEELKSLQEGNGIYNVQFMPFCNTGGGY